MYVIRQTVTAAADATVAGGTAIPAPTAPETSRSRLYPADYCFWETTESSTAATAGAGQIVDYGIRNVFYTGSGSSVAVSAGTVEFGQLGRSGNFVKIS